MIDHKKVVSLHRQIQSIYEIQASTGNQAEAFDIRQIQGGGCASADCRHEGNRGRVRRRNDSHRRGRLQDCT